MSDCTSVTFTFTPETVRTRHDEIADIFGIELGPDSSPEIEIEEANYAGDDYRNALQGAGIPYVSSWAPGDSYSAGSQVYVPDEECLDEATVWFLEHTAFDDESTTPAVKTARQADGSVVADPQALEEVELYHYLVAEFKALP